VWKAVVVDKGFAGIGFAGMDYDPKSHQETMESTAVVNLYTGTTCISSEISLDEEQHLHSNHLQPFIPKISPFPVAIRVDKYSNMPQIQFNEGVWHDFAPDGVGLKAMPLFPYLSLCNGARLTNHCVDHPKATKSAQMTKLSCQCHNDE
jgi:hypothetical protein